jgi:hypothetical protein
MRTPAISDATQREATYRRFEQAAQDAAEAERAAFVAWEKAYGAYEVACDEASAAWEAWTEAIAS